MDSKVYSIFKGVEVALIESIAKVEPKESDIYACGFWLFYCDFQYINPPCFAYNKEPEETGDRWSPPEWCVDVQDDIYISISPFYENLSTFMSGRSDADWRELIRYQYEFYCHLCRSLNSGLNSDSSPFNNWDTTPDFLIGVFEEREDEEIYKMLIESSIGKPLAAKIALR